MRKIVVLLVLAVFPFVTNAQSAFDKFEDSDEVTSFVVNKKMFTLISKFDVDDPDAAQMKEMVNSLESLKVFTTENPAVAADMKKAVNSYLKSKKMEELMRLKDKDVNIKFYIMEGKDSDHVKELLMYIDGINDIKIEGRKVESVILSLVGDIDLNKISQLTKTMNLPSELNKAQKN